MPLIIFLITLLVLILKEKTKKCIMPRIIIFIKTLIITLAIIIIAIIIIIIKAIKVIIEIIALSKST